jgi:HK97 family phage major capsid protein
MTGTGIMDNRSALAKADLALADLAPAGVLQEAQAQKFIRLLIESAVLLPMLTVVPMRSPKQLIEKIKFGSRILRPGTENAALPSGDRSKPATSKVELDAKLFKAEVRLNNETLEDSIERGALKQTVMEMMSERIALDMEELLVNGNTGSGDSFLATMNGILAQSTTSLVDAGSVTTNKTMFRDMLRTLPAQYQRNKKAMRILTSVRARIDYVDSISDRATLYGDEALRADVQPVYNGVPIMDVPVFPENLGGGSNMTNSLLLDPKNINVGIWRKIMVETDKLISEGTFLIVATVRFDVKYTEEEATVKLFNQKVA